MPDTHDTPLATIVRDHERVIPQHEDVRAKVFRVIPPRPVPWRKRAFWWALLWLLRSARARRWLQTRYGRGN